MTEVIPPTGPRRAGGPAGNGTHPPRPAPVRADFSPAARASRPPCPHGGRDFSRVRVRHGVGAGRAAGDNARSLAPPERRMADLKEARVPDIGGYDDVPVIEVLVSVGDTVDKDQGLVTLESDKATMEVPSPFAGVVKELRVKVGDSQNGRAHTSELHSLMRISYAVLWLKTKKKHENSSDRSLRVNIS